MESRLFSKPTLMDILSDYEKRNASSKKMYKRACEALPAGCSRNSVYYPPFPVYLVSGKGSHVTDIDGNERIDLNYNNTTLILGHNNPAVIAAVEDQLTRSTVLGSPTEAEVRMAEELLRRLSNAERVRFTPSGTEANLQAVRLARAYTGREKIAKFEGCYHGSWDAVDVSVGPPPEKAGPAGSPISVRQNEGLPEGVLQNTVVLPYNDPVAVDKILRKNKDDLAAVIIDPCWRDEEADHEFMRALRDVTQSLGILLIYDEVIAFRVGHRGAQGIYGVKPDITTMGKIIGGGFPVGAYASTSEIMRPQTWPEAKFPDLRGARLAFSGTFNAHPITMAAGFAILEQMQPGEFEILNRTGHELREQLGKVLDEVGVFAQVGGIGSLFNITWIGEKIRNYRDATKENRALGKYLSLALMNRGVFMLGHANISTAVTKGDVSTVVDAVTQSIEELKPIIRERAPALLKF